MASPLPPMAEPRFPAAKTARYGFGILQLAWNSSRRFGDTPVACGLSLTCRTAVRSSRGETTRCCDSGMRKPTRRSALSHLRIKGLSTASLSAPDGRNAVSASKDMTLRLWDLETGQLTRVLKGHNSWVISVAISRDGRYALSGGADKAVKLWDLTTGAEVKAFMGHTQSVLGVDLSPDGRTALSASWDKTIKLWDIASGREIQTLTGHSDWVRNVAFASDGWKALSASNDKTVRFWDFTRPTKTHRIRKETPGCL